MFELLTCRQPLAEINNINVHVVHGGRPTLKTEVRTITVHCIKVSVILTHDYRITIYMSVKEVFMFCILICLYYMDNDFLKIFCVTY